MTKELKKLIVFIVGILMLCACKDRNPIPDTSIIEELSIDQLSAILDYEHSMLSSKDCFFEDMYKSIREDVDTLGAIEKANINKVTYREMYDALYVLSDSLLQKKIYGEWNSLHELYMPQAVEESKKIQREFDDYVLEGLNNGTIKTLGFKRYVWLSHFNKYLDMLPDRVGESLEWDYDVIINDKIDSEYESERIYALHQFLKKIKDEYPNAHIYFSRWVNKIIVEEDDYNRKRKRESLYY